jgi:hypothetical protein
MRTLAAFVAGLMLVAGPASAAGPPSGRIAGRVINGATGEPQPGVPLRLSSARRDGSDRIVRRVRTDEGGRYVFSGLPLGPDRFFVVDARFQNGLFPGRPVELTRARPALDTSIRVWPTTTDPQAIVIRSDRLFVVPNENGAGVIESVAVANVSAEAYVGRGSELGADDDPAVPSLAFSLPPGATNTRFLDATVDVPQLVPAPGGFGITSAIPPGDDTRFTFSYEIPRRGPELDLSRVALYPMLDYSIFAAAPLEVDGTRLSPDGSVELRGTNYRRWSAPDDIDAGDRLQAVAVAEAGSDPLLIGGLLVLLAVVAVGAAAALLLRKRPKAVAPRRPGRAELIEAIAELDLRHEAGEMDDRAWAQRRAELKQRLSGASKEVEPAS